MGDRDPHVLRLNVAEDHAVLLSDHLATEPVHRHVIALFAELVRSRGGGRVLDLGCGPDRLSGYLRELGLDIEGLDLSTGMVPLQPVTAGSSPRREGGRLTWPRTAAGGATSVPG